MALQIRRVKNSENKKTTKCYKGWFLNTNKIPCMLLLKFKDDL